jgi:hypothetical protein
VPEPGTGAIFEVTPVGGKPFSVLTLTRQQAVNALKSDNLWGGQRVVVSDNDILADDDLLRVSAVGNNTFFDGEDLPDLLLTKIRLMQKYRNRKPHIPADTMWLPAPGTTWPKFD